MQLGHDSGFDLLGILIRNAIKQVRLGHIDGVPERVIAATAVLLQDIQGGKKVGPLWAFQSFLCNRDDIHGWHYSRGQVKAGRGF